MEDSFIPIVIDIEASGLGETSYPVEIGLVMPNGSSYCYLIQPYSNWTHWDEVAERLHGLSRKTADRFGMNGEYVARQLNKHLENQTVYSDRWEDDNKWLTMLFDQAGIRQKFQLTQLDDIITDDQKTIWEATRNIVIHESGLKRHRASSDARIVQTTWVRSLPAGRSQSF